MLPHKMLTRSFHCLKSSMYITRHEQAEDDDKSKRGWGGGKIAMDEHTSISCVSL
eukprot:m.55081 g.55081  ORF g.55081 m.55081 type:complete len:55 (-) comp7737_c0_seq2:659-823(-)